MTQAKIELLIKDLCARLPYSTLCYCKWTKDAPNGTSGCVQEVSTYLLEELMIMDDQNYECQICEIKPYLRPLSSMTEKEKKEFQAFHCIYELHPDFQPMMCNLENELNMFDWLNAHYFDYRGLIPMGLALEAPEGMYKN